MREIHDTRSTNMLQTVTLFIKQKLDHYLVNLFSLEESITVLNHLVTHDGSAPPKNRNKMVITVINLDYDTNKPYYGGQLHGQDHQVIRFNPGYTFNVDLLYTASFDDYEESLKFLNATIGYFQSNISITRKTAPDLPNGVHALRFDILNSTLFETHNLWSAIGAKYQPSVIYKVRHINVQQDKINLISPPVLDANKSVVSDSRSPDIRRKRDVRYNVFRFKFSASVLGMRDRLSAAAVW